jgi:hypothetical protein
MTGACPGTVAAASATPPRSLPLAGPHGCRWCGLPSPARVEPDEQETPVRYTITHCDGRIEHVAGDALAVETSGATVIYRDTTVMNRSRRIVARRFLASEGVTAVESVGGHAGRMVSAREWRWPAGPCGQPEAGGAGFLGGRGGGGTAARSPRRARTPQPGCCAPRARSAAPTGEAPRPPGPQYQARYGARWRVQPRLSAVAARVRAVL